jgi:hypothetical protein
MRAWAVQRREHSAEQEQLHELRAQPMQLQVALSSK